MKQPSTTKRQRTRGVVITGLGSAIPDGILTNADIEARDIGTNDQWIVERTGISERRQGGTTIGLACEAARAAMAQARCSAEDIDLVIVATCTPDHLIAASAAKVQSELGIKGGAFDLNAACTGFVYSLIVGAGMLANGLNRVLIIGSETLSRFTDPMDRNTVILFGDGAGAVVLEAVEGEGNLLGWDIGSDGSSYEDLYANIGGFMLMDGKAIFKKAVLAMTESGNSAMTNAGVTSDDIDLFVPHQANTRIIDLALERMEFPKEKAVLTLHKFGNTSAASIPLALSEAQADGRLKDGQTILLCGFGAGMTSASAVIKWGRSS